MTSLFDDLLTSIKRRFRPRANIQQLLRATPIGYYERSRDLYRPKYIGFKFDFEDQPLTFNILTWMKRLIGNTAKITYVSLYFSQKSAGSNKNYLHILRMPYRQNPDQYRLEDLPIQYYCECDAFKYFIAYALNTTGNIFKTPTIEQRLGIALKQRPKIRNPKEIRFFCKHGVNIINEIHGRRLTYFLNDRYKIKSM